MKQKTLLLCLFLLLISAMGVVLWWKAIPRSPEQHHARLKRQLGRVLPGDLEGFRSLEQQYEQVERLLEQKFPDSELRDLIALERIEIVDRHIGDTTAAIELYLDFPSRFPASELQAQCIYRRGELLLQQKRYLPAVQAFREVTTRFPDHALADDAQYQVGMIYQEIQESQAALEALREVVEKYPDSPNAPRAQLQIAEILGERMQSRREAIQELERLQESYPQSIEASIAAGIGRVLGEEVSREDQQDYQRQRYRYGIPDHTRSWQDERERALNQRIAAQGLDIEHYDLHAVIIPEQGLLQARVAMTLQSGHKDAREFLFRLGSQLELSRVSRLTTRELPSATEQSLESVLDFKHEEEVLALLFPQEIPAGETLSLLFEYSGNWSSPMHWKGDFIAEGSGYLRAESQWYPYTVWGDNATSRVVFDLPDPYLIVSNGVQVSDERVEDMRRVTWEMDQPYFGITAVYGNLVESVAMLHLPDRNMPLFCYTFPEHRAQATAILDEVGAIVLFYSGLFGELPYPNLKIVETPPFPGGYGACTLVLLTDAVFQDEIPRWLLAHEVSHQWWGNLVGVRIDEEKESIPWLTEGFATYSDILYSESLEPGARLVQHLNKYANLYYEHAGVGFDESIRSVRWRSPLYQAITYQKGSLVLHALRFMMEDEAFFAALQEYASRYAFQGTLVEDFQEVCQEFYRPEPQAPELLHQEEYSDLSWFFEQWLDRPGIPILKIESVIMTPDDARYRIEVKIDQAGEIYWLPIELRLDGARESLTRRVWLTEKEHQFEFDLSWIPQEIELDPNHWILKDPSPKFLRWQLREDAGG